jgi:hypothetical protein
MRKRINACCKACSESNSITPARMTTVPPFKSTFPVESGLLTSYRVTVRDCLKEEREARWCWMDVQRLSVNSLELFIINEIRNSFSGWSVTYDGGCLVSTRSRQSARVLWKNQRRLRSRIRALCPPNTAELRVVGNNLYAANRNDRKSMLYEILR